MDIDSIDKYGHRRGACNKCRDCDAFISHAESVRCGRCNCRPVDHLRLSLSSSHVVEDESILVQVVQGSICQFSGCREVVTFDIDTGLEEDFCPAHEGCFMPSFGANTDIWIVEDITDDDDSIMTGEVQTTVSSVSMASIITTPPATPPITLPAMPPAPTCALSDCNNPRYVDDSGHVHECCGYTHAMEHQRRQIVQQSSSVVKGVTHCLLPECNRPTWPFQNYCSRTHADIGQERGLILPLAQQTASGQTSTNPNACIYPNCQRPKYIESDGTTHPYCGKTHAELAKQQGIFPSADKTEDQCDLEGCSRPKRSEGSTQYDYCCKDHATQDAPNREANQLLTSRAEVDKWLKQFHNLKVVKITENDHAKPPDGALFKKFKAAALSLPKNQRKTCLGFHGSSPANITSICANGYNPKLRSGQSYGPGEYFATTPDVSLGYCKGGKQMLLNQLLLGQAGAHHTQHGNIIVMKDPAHDLPRYIIDFQ